VNGKTITTTREYDDQGRVTKETTIEVEWPEPYRDSGQWWQPVQPWWQNPVISYTVTNNTDRLLMNSAIV
jgi:hypothetical protein